MTPPQPHPLRCETCGHWQFHKLNECDADVMQATVSSDRREFISIIGCASHSSRPAPAPMYPRPPCDECPYQKEPYTIYNNVAIAAQHRYAAIVECRNIVWNKIIHSKCDNLCDTCYLCDNTGGCIAESLREARR